MQSYSFMILWLEIQLKMADNWV